jgi:hypothetical protein
MLYGQRLFARLSSCANITSSTRLGPAQAEEVARLTCGCHVRLHRARSDCLLTAARSCYDLEDSVAIAQKSGARKNVLECVAAMDELRV